MHAKLLGLAIVFAIAACGGESRLQDSEQSATRASFIHVPRADECETEWPGPWTECPQADWVRLVAEDAGYRITDETGSALIAEGRGQSFYIWSSDANSALFQKRLRDGWKTTGVVDGVPVYGDGRIWRWWIADGVDLVVWLSAGPHVDARLPTLDELLPLLGSTMTVAPTW